MAAAAGRAARRAASVQPAEAAVAHDEHLIARPGGAGQLARQRLDVGAGVRATAESAEHLADVPAEVAPACTARPHPRPRARRARVCRCTPMRMVCERGSSTAMMRAAPARRRSPSMVVAIAVGWCAKSSYTRMPSTSPRSCMRRAMPLKALERRERLRAAPPRHVARRRSLRARSPCCARRSAPIARVPRGRAASRTSKREKSSAPVRARAPQRFGVARRVQSPRAASSSPSPASPQQRIGGVPDDAAAARHDAHQVVELALDGGHVRDRCRRGRIRDC